MQLGSADLHAKADFQIRKIKVLSFMLLKPIDVYVRMFISIPPVY